MSARTAPKINVSPDQYFSCTSCGKCCTTTWRIRVASEELPKIRESESYQSLERQGYQPLPLVDSQHELGRDSKGACLFLNSEGCSLHAESGLHSKPSVCQLYPFGFIDTPDGYFVSLSYSCPAVLAGKGEAMSDKLEELQSIVEESPYLQAQNTPPNSRVVLSENLTVDWAHYLQLEAQILETLSSGDPVTGLVQTASALAHYSRNPSTPVQLAFQGKTSLISEQAWNILPLFACSVISVLEIHDPNSERAGLSETLLSGGSAYSDQLQCELPPFHLEPADNLVTRNIIKHYIRNTIFGKKLLQGPSVTARLLMLATSVSVLLYYLKIRTQASQSLHFSFEGLEWGFDLIETNILTHSSDLEELFLEYERALLAYAEVFEAA